MYFDKQSASSDNFTTIIDVMIHLISEKFTRSYVFTKTQ